MASGRRKEEFGMLLGFSDGANAALETAARIMAWLREKGL